ncbi:MAG: AbrB/MazE/SpoVT family DNA-binding domain-containing protein [Cyanobacteria bacterium J06621_8]
MEIELRKWVNSIGLRIPNKIAQSMDLNKNSKIELTQSGDSLIIKNKCEEFLYYVISSKS